MRSILCFTSRYCPHKGEVRGFDNPELSGKPRPYFSCRAKSLEWMQSCILREDKDLQKYGVKILVKDDQVTKAWDPKKILLQRLDRDEQIDGSEFGRMEV